MKTKTKIEVGAICRITGGEIKKLTAKVCCVVFDVDENQQIYHYFIKHDGKKYDLNNGHIDFARFYDFDCDIYGDFLPPKTTKTGKIVNKFFVLRIEKKQGGSGNEQEQKS